MDYVSRIPPVFINFECVVLDDGADLIESCRLIMLRRLIKIRVGSPEQQEQ